MSEHPHSSGRKWLGIVSLFLALVVSAACSKVNDSSSRTSPESAQTNPQRKQIEEKINQLIRAQLGKDVAIAPESRLMQDLKADELDVVELVMRVEEEFKIEISDDDATRLGRVKDLYDYVEKRLKKSG